MILIDPICIDPILIDPILIDMIRCATCGPDLFSIIQQQGSMP
ncbi:MAG TPA: hypothetical protein VFI49_06460 [Rudaea sp.]|nr:hypothetical protein [Rudaea sp.]